MWIAVWDQLSENHAKTNRLSPLLPNSGTCVRLRLSRVVYCCCLLGVTRFQKPSTQLLLLPAQPGRGPVPCMSRPATQSRASIFKWGASFALDVSLAEI